MPNCAHDRYALATVLVEVHPYWFFTGAPSVALSHPHVAAGFVEVDYVLVLLDSASEFNGEGLDLADWNETGTAELVLDNSVGDTVTTVESTERVGGHAKSLLMKQLNTLVQVQRGPVVQHVEAEKEVLHWACDLQVSTPHLLEVQLAALHESESIFLVPPYGVENRGHGQVHELCDLDKRANWLRIRFRILCTIAEKGHAAKVHMLQWSFLDYLQPGQPLLLLAFFERGAIKEGG